MPGLMNSGAIPAVVAYAKVNADGTSPNCNSGVTTERLGTGIYRITVPASLAQPLLGARDLVILTIRNEDGGANGLASLNYFWTSETEITISGFNGIGEGGDADLSFDFVLLRSTISPPLNAPA